MPSQQVKNLDEQRGSLSKEYFCWELSDDISTLADEYRSVMQYANAFSLNLNPRSTHLSGLFMYCMFE